MPRNSNAFHLQHNASLRNAVNTALPSLQQILQNIMQQGALPELAVEQADGQAVGEYKNLSGDDGNDADM